MLNLKNCWSTFDATIACSFFNVLSLMIATSATAEIIDADYSMTLYSGLGLENGQANLVIYAKKPGAG